MIRDQRHMYAGFAPQTVADVRQVWERIAGAVGLRLHETGDFRRAYISHGRWVADCACAGGIEAWAGNPHGACLSCGAVYEIEFPAPKLREGAETVLDLRPFDQLKNWKPWEQSLTDLQAENLSGADLPHDFAGIVGPKGPLGPSELMPEFAAVLEADRVPELGRGSR